MFNAAILRYNRLGPGAFTHLERTMETIPFTEIWQELAADIQDAHARLIGSLEGCWKDFQSVLEDRCDRLASLPGLEAIPTALGRYPEIRSRAADELLLDVVVQMERLRIFQRAAMCFEMYQANLEEIHRRLPDAVEVSPEELVRLWGRDQLEGVWPRLAGWIRLRRRLPLNALVGAGLAEHQRLFLRWLGRFYLALLPGFRLLPGPWSLAQALMDHQVTGRPLSDKRVARRRKRFESEVHRVMHQATGQLARWRNHDQALIRRIQKRLLSGCLLPGRQARPIPQRALDRFQAHWSTQIDIIEEELQTQLAIEQCERLSLRELQVFFDRLRSEKEQVCASLGQLVQWLKAQAPESLTVNFTPPRLDVAPAAQNLKNLEQALAGRIDRLPERSRRLAALRARPGLRQPRQIITPRSTLQKALQSLGGPGFAQLLEDAESHYRDTFQLVERCREVIAYGLQKTDDTEVKDAQVAREALENTVSLLEFHLVEAEAWLPALEQGLPKVMASVFLENRLLLNLPGLGIWARVFETGLSRSARLAWRSAQAAAGRLAHSASQLLNRAVKTGLSWIGWKPKDEQALSRVTVRPFLPAEFTVDLGAKELPALYRRLFRLEPVTDARFLVGRDQELAAVSQARTFWETGRPTAVMITGPRGSGKTSLINCLSGASLAGVELVRGEVGARIVTAAGLFQFLAGLTGSGDAGSLAGNLSRGRRVIILEEAERLFLRQVGYFGAIRALQQLIAATSRHTLWILVINQMAFRFLDAAVDLGHTFSHRIDAGAANGEMLRKAILIRHNLSGLRLKFPPLAPGHRLENRLRRWTGRAVMPETAFFETLAGQSGGIFRTAFDIWLGQVESVRGGELSLKPLAPIDLSRVIADLGRDDVFTLAAVMQHGSLRVDEHEWIFQRGRTFSQAQMDELLARELIEPDPSHEGFRVRPEANRLVAEALYRQNIL